MREAVDSKIGRDQRLNRAADAEEVHEFVDRIILRDEHQRASPHQHTAQVKRKHGLDRPLTNGVLPCVPENLVDQQGQRKRPADFALGCIAPILETEQEKVQQEDENQRADVRGAEELEGGTGVISRKELSHSAIVQRAGKKNSSELEEFLAVPTGENSNITAMESNYFRPAYKSQKL